MTETFPHNADTSDRFRTIVYEYQDAVYNQAYRMLGTHEDAEEAAQDVFMSVHRSLDEFRGDSKLSTWIFKITANTCVSRLRKKQLTVMSLDKEGEEGGTLYDVLPDKGLSPEEALVSNDTAEYIREQIQNLPPDWAMAISLFHFEGLSYDETAEVMGIPRSTVATYIFRGRKELARHLMDVVY